MTEEQYAIVVDEANERGLAPSIVARMAFAAGLADIRKKRHAVKRQTNYAKRKAKRRGAARLAAVLAGESPVGAILSLAS